MELDPFMDKIGFAHEADSTHEAQHEADDSECFVC